jgi:hypothetical protein
MKGIMYFIRVLFALVLLLTPTPTFAGTVQLPQTGQTTSYAAGDDGALQMGAAWPNPRFTDKGDQTVMDNLSGLIWAKDGNIMKTHDPGFDTDSTAGDGTVTWQHALDYIKKLNQENYLGHNDWRLPNVIELESLVNAGQSNQAAWLNSQAFSNVQAYNYNYWSSSTYAYYTNVAWLVNMYDGQMNFTYKSDSNYVWPVRAGQSGSLGSSIISLPRTGQTMCYDASGSSILCAGTGQDGEFQMGAAWPNPRFTDKGDQTVMDNLTGLIWSKDGKTPGPATCGPGGTKPWQGAMDYVNCLNTNNYLGHNDWRQPNRKELLSLVNNWQKNSANWLILQGYSNVAAENYWSSNTYANYTPTAWSVNMYVGTVYGYSKNNSYYIWPVRAGQSGSFASLVISKSGSGTGTIVAAGLSCGSQCSAYFNLGTSVTLTAQAASGSTFAGWSGGGCQGTGICTLTLNTDTTITATFTREPVGKGDINYDGQVNLTDAILALQVIACISSQQIVYKEADVNSDRKIGLADVLYILQKAAAIR